MRIKQEFIDACVNIIGKFLAGNKAKFYLFGSRVDDNKKGGDIDFLLLVANNETLLKMKKEKYKIIAEIKKNTEDQKIDLKIAKEDNSDEDVFLLEIMKSAQLLFEW
ncbi:MAG: nucleotidyltransferase domain-containing protein [Pseudomonadota bacterium]